jgi:hypothetical protein
MWNPRISGSGNAKLSTAFDVIHRFILLFAWDMPEILVGVVETAVEIYVSHRCAIDVCPPGGLSTRQVNLLKKGCNTKFSSYYTRSLLEYYHGKYSGQSEASAIRYSKFQYTPPLLSFPFREEEAWSGGSSSRRSQESHFFSHAGCFMWTAAKT